MQKQIKSPFFIVRDFLSVKQCAEIKNLFSLAKPNIDSNGYPLAYECANAEAESVIFERFQALIPSIEERYVANYVGTEEMRFQQFPEGIQGNLVEPRCENAVFNAQKKVWNRVRDVDLTAVVWLSQYNDSVPFDPRYEVYGGRLEFPAYGFGFNPEAGTLVIYPAGPHFIWAIPPISAGNLYQVRFNITLRDKANLPWKYRPADFPGTWREWLSTYY